MGVRDVVRRSGLVASVLAVAALSPMVWGHLPGVGAAPGAGEADPVLVSVSPFRLVDTRPAPADPTGGPDEPFGPNTTRTYTVAGVGAVPAGAVAVALNVTAVDATAGGYVTVFPANLTSPPLAASLNPSPGNVAFNAVTVPLSGGQFKVFNANGSVHLVIDVVGYTVDHDHDERYLERAQPIVVTHGAGEFARTLDSSYPTVMRNRGHVLDVSGDGSLLMPLSAPTAVGGTEYRLAGVEWCIASDTAHGSVVTSTGVLYQNLVPPFNLTATAKYDLTDRTAAGCYTLTVPAVSARAYSLLLELTGQTTDLTESGVTLTAVKSTWVPVST